MPRYEGRLELTWTNKDQSLLAHEDGSYEWLPPSDYRVAEVRLLDELQTVGEVTTTRALDNLLIRGDALHALTSLNKLPEFRGQFVGKVKLAYLDPPFNTGQAFADYDDNLEHSVWLTMMRDRLLQIKPLLADDGSVWVHLDDEEVHRCRGVLDEVFGADCFIATVIWEKDKGRKSDTHISTAHDYLLIYSPARDAWQGVRNLLPRTAGQVGRYRNPDHDPRGPWLQGDNGTAKSGGEGSRWPITLPSGRKVTPPGSRGWAFGKATFDLALKENRVYFGRNGDGMPIIKKYLSEVQDGVVPRTLWMADEVGHNQEAKRDHLRKMFPSLLPFATPKPERLMQRIIQIATDDGDLVLDCFGGSGTTAAVAQKMGRRWAIVERSAETIAAFTFPRLKMVVEGKDPWGVSTAVVPAVDGLPDVIKAGEPRTASKVLKAMSAAGLLDEVEGLSSKTVAELAKALQEADKTKIETLWTGGGGFRFLSVSSSMFEEEGGLVFLADGLANGALAEATAAQLGFEYAPSPPFAGRKGRARLAVVDGVVNEGVVRLLVSALDENERAVICGTGIDPVARPVLRGLAPGSTLRKIPSALLERYRSDQDALVPLPAVATSTVEEAK